jgi:8-oxo-dGTP pyrophosphatase MutT (NUDIX family)
MGTHGRAQCGPERVTRGRKDVVTAWIQREDDGKVLIVQRSAHVRTYQGKYGAVSGSVEQADKSLVGRALEEIHEEVGYGIDQVALVRSGRPLWVDDGPLRFAVHPFLFNLRDAGAAPVLNWENSDAMFVDPAEIGAPGGVTHTVPLLKETLERLLLTPEQEAALQRLAQDRTHGAAELAKQALCILEGARLRLAALS